MLDYLLVITVLLACTNSVLNLILVVMLVREMFKHDKQERIVKIPDYVPPFSSTSTTTKTNQSIPPEALAPLLRNPPRPAGGFGSHINKD
jgi:hypothetical protein